MSYLARRGERERKRKTERGREGGGKKKEEGRGVFVSWV